MPIIGSSKLQITGDITASGAIVAEEFKTDFISGSILFNSGSTRFGDTRDDTHEFTGSISLSGSNVSFLGGSDVGIGTSSPNNSAKLGIAGNINVGNGQSSAVVYFENSGTDVYIQGNASKLQFGHVGNTQSVQITAGGNIVL